MSRIRATMGFHTRNAALIFASQYNDVNRALLEVLQNIIDAESHRCDVHINLHHRNITIFDNGSGASVGRMQDTVGNIAESRKKSERPWGNQAFGRYGIGILAFFDKVSETDGTYTVTTGPRSGRDQADWEGMHTWSFTELIRGTESEDVFGDPQATLTAEPEWWSTRVQITDITVAQMGGFNRERIFDGLQRFGSIIDNCCITFHLHDKSNHPQEPVVFRRKQYVGQPIEPFTVTGRECGSVRFELYFSDVAPSRPNLMLRTGDCAQFIPWANVSRQIEARVGTMDQAAVDVYNSGHFQGEIIAERGDMTADRNSLVQDDAFLDLACVLEGWALEEGAQLLKTIQSSNTKQRREKGLEEAVSKLAGLLRGHSDDFTPALQTLGTSVSKGHVTPPDGEPAPGGREKRRRHSTADKPTTITPTETDTTIETEQKKRTPPTTERTREIHISYYADDGTERVLAKGDRGMRFRYGEMLGSSDPFTINRGEGVIVINTRHPVFGWAEQRTRVRTGQKRRDYTFNRYLEVVVESALVLLMQPLDCWPDVMLAFDTQLRIWKLKQETPTNVA